MGTLRGGQRLPQHDDVANGVRRINQHFMRHIPGIRRAGFQFQVGALGKRGVSRGPHLLQHRQDVLDGLAGDVRGISRPTNGHPENLGKVQEPIPGKRVRRPPVTQNGQHGATQGMTRLLLENGNNELLPGNFRPGAIHRRQVHPRIVLLYFRHIQHQAVRLAAAGRIAVIARMHPLGGPGTPQLLHLHLLGIGGYINRPALKIRLQQRHAFPEAVHNIIQRVLEIVLVPFQVRPHGPDHLLQDARPAPGFRRGLLAFHGKRLHVPAHGNDGRFQLVQVLGQPGPGALHQVKHQPERHQIASHRPPDRVFDQRGGIHANQARHPPVPHTGEDDFRQV